jgi:hypothetical protein
MLTAKFLKMGKGGALAIYEVQGTSTELANFVKANYKDREPAFKSTIDGKPITDSNGNKVPLYFTSYPLPGKNTKHPLYQIQAGTNAGQFTLDKSELQFDALVAKSMGADLGQAIAAKAAERYADSTPISSAASSLLDDDDEDSEEDFTAPASEDAEGVASEDATMDVVGTTTAKKTTK